jgi:hypothetical protein
MHVRTPTIAPSSSRATKLKILYTLDVNQHCLLRMVRELC